MSRAKAITVFIQAQLSLFNPLKEEPQVKIIVDQEESKAIQIKEED